MPIINEEKLAKMLKDSFESKVWLLFGNDTMLKDMYCDKLVKSVVSDSLKAFNLRLFNDDDAELEEIFEAADTMPMMSDKACVLVRNYPLAGLRKEQLEIFENGLKNIPDSTVLIFFFNTVEINYGKSDGYKWTEVIDLIMKCGGVCARIDKRTPERTARLLVSRAKERKTEISPDGAKYLIQTVGGDMQVVQNEFNKLCSYADGKPITREMIDDICSKTIEASSYEISKYILSNNTIRAYKTVNELLRQKIKKELLLGSVAAAFVNAYRYKLALNNDRGTGQFKEAFSINANLSDLAPFVRSTPLSKIKRCLDILLEADARIKSASVDEVALFTELTARLAATVNE